MAKLHRVVKSDDRLNTHVFTFILPLSLGSDNAKDIISPEFMCGHHKWNVSLVKQEKDSHVGAYLTLKSPGAGLYVTVDYGFTLLNRGHYTKNESFMEAGKVFTKQTPTQGRKAFISTTDIKNSSKGFLMEKDQLFMEVTLCNFKTHFEYQLQLPMTDKDRQRYPPNDVRLESGCFSFGGSEWNVNMKINERNPTDARGGSVVALRRLSNFDHYCKFKYRISIGVMELTPLPGVANANSTTATTAAAGTTAAKPVPQPMHNPNAKVIHSNEMDSLFIDAETQDKLVLPTNIYKLATIKGIITIRIQCTQSIVLTLLQIPMDRNRHRALRCYDRDKQAWLFEAHMKSDKLKFYVFYGDIATVPRGCIRMISIGVSVLPAYGNVKMVRGINSPYTKFYVQRQQDDFGLEIPTGIAMKDIIDTKSIYIYDNTNSLTVQIEWGDSYLLKDPEYNSTDNVVRLHKMQMEKEMKMLQKENLILEKQVHSYQTAIAQKDSKGEFDPNQMAIRPQPTGQAQTGYGDQMGDRMMSDPYGNRMVGGGHGQPGQYPNMGGLAPQHGLPNMGGIAPQHSLPNTGQMNPAAMAGHPGATDMGYNSPYGGRNDLGAMDTYDRQHRGYSGDGASLPVPADRGPRSRSADPTGSPYVSPLPERKPARRNSATGAEYADYLEQSPNSRYNRNIVDERNRNYDGYRSDSGYRSDTMAKTSDGSYNDPYYGGKDSRPRPTVRGGKGADTRSDYGDYYSERDRRSKLNYDRDVDAYSDRSHKSSGGGSRGGARYPPADKRNPLQMSAPGGRASYAGYEGDYLPPETHYKTAGSSYPNTPRAANYGRSPDYPPRRNNSPLP